MVFHREGIDRNLEFFAQIHVHTQPIIKLVGRVFKVVKKVVGELGYSVSNGGFNSSFVNVSEVPMIESDSQRLDVHGTFVQKEA